MNKDGEGVGRINYGGCARPKKKIKKITGLNVGI